MYWDLEDYNSWNLPFAKTVQIVGRKNIDPDAQSTFSHSLTADSYKLEVDTSALFSIIFVSNTTLSGYDDSDLRTLNYTFLGNKEMVTYQGVWTDVQMTIPRLNGVIDESNYSKVNVTIFVAFGVPVDAGLDGTLSLSVAPEDWSNVSVVSNIDDLPTIYLSYLFTQDENN